MSLWILLIVFLISSVQWKISIGCLHPINVRNRKIDDGVGKETRLGTINLLVLETGLLAVRLLQGP